MMTEPKVPMTCRDVRQCTGSHGGSHAGERVGLAAAYGGRCGALTCLFVLLRMQTNDTSSTF